MSSRSTNTNPERAAHLRSSPATRAWTAAWQQQSRWAVPDYGESPKAGSRLRAMRRPQHVAEHEPVALYGRADLAANERAEDGTGVDERVELAVLAARVDVRREIG